MAKSKFIKANAQIAQGLASGFQTIQDTVTGAYTNIEDCFVEQYLTREDETVADAKIRLKQDRNRSRKSSL